MSSNSESDGCVEEGECVEDGGDTSNISVLRRPGFAALGVVSSVSRGGAAAS